MKDWQHGYELDYLIELTKRFDDYNKHSMSPFSVIKKNNVASGLHDGSLHIQDNVCYERKVSKVKVPIAMHGDVKFATKLPGDVIYDKIVGDITPILKDETSEHVWIYDWYERDKYYPGFDLMGVKISTYGERMAILYRGPGKQERTISVDPVEYVSLKKLGTVDLDTIISIREKLSKLPEWTSHYSAYNYTKTWYALSLRGYSPDPSFITDPSEMNDAWHAKNPGPFAMQNTPIYDVFREEVEKLLSFVDGEIHRIRFMKLAANNANNSELGLHTDQVDKSSGTNIGKLARIHFPIITHPNVTFTVVPPIGQSMYVNMQPGEYWMLDTRKPHCVTNKSSIDRVHLVVDVIVTPKLKEMLV